jgi:hypothetical protein
VRQEGTRGRRDLSRYEKILAAHGAAVYADASAAARQAVAAPTEHHRAIRDVAAGVAAPLLCSYVRWTAEQAQRAGVRRLYFVARDGDVLLRIALACPDLARDFDLRYLYGSRHSWYLAGVDASDLGSQPWLTEDADGLGPALFLARLGIHPDDMAVALDRGGFGEAPLGPDGLRGIVRALSTPAATTCIAQAVHDRRAIVHRYLRQEGMFDGVPSAIVDLGWAGRMFAALAAAVAAGGSTMPHVFLFGLLRIVPVTFPCTAWLFDATDPTDVPVHRIAAAVEAFCLSPTGHLTGYARDDDGEVVPVLNYADGQASRRWGVATLQSTIVAVATLLDDDPPPLSRDTAVALLRMFWCRPSRAEAAAWSRCPYEVDQQATVSAGLASPLRLGPSVRRCLAGQDPWVGQQWRDGARRLTPYGVRAILALAGRGTGNTPRTL